MPVLGLIPKHTLSAWCSGLCFPIQGILAVSKLYFCYHHAVSSPHKQQARTVPAWRSCAQGRGTEGHTLMPVSPPVTGSQCPLTSAGLPDPQARPLGPPARWYLAEPDPAGAATRLTRPLASRPSCPGSGAALGAPLLPQPARRAPQGSLSAPGSERGAPGLSVPRGSPAPSPGRGKRSPGPAGASRLQGHPEPGVLTPGGPADRAESS